MAADQGDRAGKQSQQRMKAEGVGDRDPQGVLQKQEGEQHQQEADQPPAAQQQQPHVGGQSDRGKKQQEKERLCGDFQGNAQAGPEAQQGDGNSEQQAADDRVRDVVFRQEPDLAGKQGPGNQHKAGSQQGLRGG